MQGVGLRRHLRQQPTAIRDHDRVVGGGCGARRGPNECKFSVVDQPHTAQINGCSEHTHRRVVGVDGGAVGNEDRITNRCNSANAVVIEPIAIVPGGQPKSSVVVVAADAVVKRAKQELIANREEGVDAVGVKDVSR